MPMASAAPASRRCRRHHDRRLDGISWEHRSLASVPPDSPDADTAWQHALLVTRPVLALATRNFLDDIRSRLAEAGIIVAVATRDTAALYDWIVGLLARQGISNHAAEVFASRHGSPTWHELSGRMAADARCPRLRSRWHYEDCGFRRSAGTCSTPHHGVNCPVTEIPARKGALAEAAVGLWLFIRDIAGGDLVGWIDARLAAADPGPRHPARAATMRDAVLLPLVNIIGTGPKVWSMILAELLLGADPQREHWVTTGASFVAVDSLVHAFLHRTGILTGLKANHTYGPACTAPGGCVDVIAGLAARVNAREFNAGFPRVFPRWVQYALWQFCAAGGLDICNGRRIDDSYGCRQLFCPSFETCARLPISVLPSR